MGIKLSKVAKTAKKYDHILIIMRHAKAEPFGDKGDWSASSPTKV